MEYAWCLMTSLYSLPDFIYLYSCLMKLALEEVYLED